MRIVDEELTIRSISGGWVIIIVAIIGGNYTSLPIFCQSLVAIVSQRASRRHCSSEFDLWIRDADPAILFADQGVQDVRGKGAEDLLASGRAGRLHDMAIGGKTMMI